MLKRLFIKLPLYLLLLLITSTFIIPIFYWITTGKCYIKLTENIEKFIDSL